MLLDDQKVKEILLMIHGEDKPINKTEYTYPDGTVVYSVGKPNIKKLAQLALAQMS